MKEQNEHHSFTGMQRDTEISKHPSTYLYDARNIRITQRDDDTLLAISNERGTQYLNVKIGGDYLGHCLLNQWLVIFSKGIETYGAVSYPLDYIEKIDLSNPSFEIITLFKGNLNFSYDHKIETVGSFENVNIQKVYWTDGYNQPRMINITYIPDIPEFIQYDGQVYVTTNSGYPAVYTGFDFVRTLKLQENVFIKKEVGANGMFPAGVIQYIFTYYDKFGQESNPFYTSPLLYTSYKDRGASAEDKVDNAFRITIVNPDTNFDYVRIYSIMRTSINATPIARRVQDIKIDISGGTTGTLSFLDTGYDGDTVDPTELLYKGGDVIVAQTLEQKDGTMFFGNITLNNEYRPSFNTEDITIFPALRSFYSEGPFSGNYSFYNHLSSWVNTTIGSNEYSHSVPCGGFKRGDYYRLGVQFQYKTGKWSDPIYIGDFMETERPSTSSNVSQLPCFAGHLDAETCADLVAQGYLKVRALVCFPGFQDRVTLCQGVACPTLFTSNNRNQDSLYAQSSWFFRPNNLNSSTDVVVSDGTVLPASYGTLYYTSSSMSNSEQETGSLDGYNPNNNSGKIRAVEIQGDFDVSNKFQIDRELFTFHSPDIEFDDSLMLIDYSGTKRRTVGTAQFNRAYSDISIQVKNGPINSSGGGFVHKSFAKDYNRGIVAGLFWDDYTAEDVGNDQIKAQDNQFSSCKWVVYPWNRTGSLNNDIERPSSVGVQSALLEKKVLATLRITSSEWLTSINETTYNNFTYYPNIFNNDQLDIIKLGESTVGNNLPKMYMGNIDTLLLPDNDEGMYFAFGNTAQTRLNEPNIETSFTSNQWWKTALYTFTYNNKTYKKRGLYYGHYSGSTWLWTRWEDSSDVGNDYSALAASKGMVRMKYKSTPHMVASCGSYSEYTPNRSDYPYLPIYEIMRPGDNDSGDKPLYRSTMFGGTSEDALKANEWLPCGEPVSLIPSETVTTSPANASPTDTVVDDNPETGTTIGEVGEQSGDIGDVGETDPGSQQQVVNDLDLEQEGGYIISVREGLPEHYLDGGNGYVIYTGRPGGGGSGTSGGSGEEEEEEEPITDAGITFYYSYGDTYYQKWDCLKTYPFTREDINQIVEIGSFMLETRVNIDGRYDRNRGQSSNINMSPINFNLMNPVYSQVDNFFTYKILDSSVYSNNTFPNQVTWTKEKQSGADIDLWTNITLASTYDMDGSKGEIVSLNTWEGNIFCFQNKGVCNILFNSRVQIPTSDGMPIEITNSNKVDGYRYLSDGVGCSNKWSIKETPAGIYFIDSVSHSMYHVSQGISDISLGHCMWNWYKVNDIDRTMYDSVHHDLYNVNSTDALCYSEILGQFTSFYDYGGIDLIESFETDVFTLKDRRLYKMFAGDYNLFFDYPVAQDSDPAATPSPWYITFVSNGVDNKDMDSDKIFTTIDYRMDMFDSLNNDEYLPEESFDSVRVWNEYQDTGDVTLKHPVVISSPTSYNLDEMNLEKKYRIWRIQIPRDNTKVLDRIRNPWCKIKLGKTSSGLFKAVLQDLNVQYFV